MRLTKHAAQRLRERRISERELQLTIARGTPHVSHGAVRVFWRDIVAVCQPHEWGIDVLTAYRLAAQ
jgi:hypothetical protein